jgi:hypothetical protein
VFKSLTPALLTATLIALVGCQTKKNPEMDPKVMKTFTHDMQQALINSVATANTGKQVGVVKLRVTLNRHSAPIACKAFRAPPSQDQLLPTDVPRSDFKALARLVEAQCWVTIYPIVPDNLYDENNTVEIVAPLFVNLPAAAQAPGSARGVANAQREYFWQQLLRDEPVTSVGNAAVYYQANARGKVEGCLVQLYQHPLRPDDFRLDGDLQARLNKRCMALDLSRMPGFSPDMHGVAKGSSKMEYAPWRVGRL